MSQSPWGRTPVLRLPCPPAGSWANLPDASVPRGGSWRPREDLEVCPTNSPPPPRQRPHHHPQTVRPRQAGKIHAHHAVSEVSLARIVDRDFHHHGTLRFR